MYTHTHKQESLEESRDKLQRWREEKELEMKQEEERKRFGL